MKYTIDDITDDHVTITFTSDDKSITVPDDRKTQNLPIDQFDLTDVNNFKAQLSEHANAFEDGLRMEQSTTVDTAVSALIGKTQVAD